MKKLLLSLAAVAMAAGAYAQIVPGEYYIKNVETGMFLNEGLWWATHSVVKSYPCEFQVEETDGHYLLKSPYGYMKGDGPWMDGKLEEAGHVTVEAKDNGYLMKVGDNYVNVLDPMNYLGYIDLYNVEYVAESNNSLWQFITFDEMVASLNKATPEKPVDASFFIKAAEIQYAGNTYAQQSWKYIKNGQPAEIVIAETGWDGLGGELERSVYAWCINDGSEGAVDGTDVVSQDIEGMPAGYYEVEYRVVNQANTHLTVKFNDTECKPYEYEGSDLWYKGAWLDMVEHPQTATFTVGEDGKLSIKMEKTINSKEQNRFAFKSFKLFYKGKDLGSGVQNIAIDNENAPVEYYNLQGLRVANPEKGLYIVRQGNKVSKVIL